MPPPKPFELTAQMDEVAQGGQITWQVKQTHHLLDGLWICLSRRDEIWNGMCNLVVFRDKPLSITDPGALFFGYASLDLARD